jgi:thiol-disulfide isomerase/thioredoxin
MDAGNCLMKGDTMQFGSLNGKAQELRVGGWIDGNGDAMEKPLQLADLGDGYKIIYCFQHWCPGCHSRGFPTLKYLHDNLKDKGFSFAVIQTVFEGAEVNTFDKLRVNQEQYSLKIPFGHDVPVQGERHSSFMEDYASGGTPWFTVIDPQGDVVYADFQIDPVRFMKALGSDDVEFENA